MRKKKGAAEFFELFKTRVKRTGLERPGSSLAQVGTVAEPSPAPAIGETPAAGWLAPDNGKGAPLEGPGNAPLAEADAAVSPGERTFTISMNIAALIVLLLLMASFTAFGFGIWYGREQARKEAQTNEKSDIGGRDEEAVLKIVNPKQVLPRDRTPDPTKQNEAKTLAKTTEKKPADVLKEPGPGISKPVTPKPPETKPVLTQFFTIRLIDYDLDDRYCENNSKRQVKILAESGLSADIRKIVRDGKTRVAVCYGKFETEAAAERDLPRLRDFAKPFESADVIFVSEKR